MILFSNHKALFIGLQGLYGYLEASNLLSSVVPPCCASYLRILCFLNLLSSVIHLIHASYLQIPHNRNSSIIRCTVFRLSCTCDVSNVATKFSPKQ